MFALTKEAHFFDWHYELGINWYRERFAGATERVVGESNPNYMYFDWVPPRLAEHLPDARLIAILRDPIDRAYSHYWHNRTRGAEQLSFAAAIDAEVERLADADARLRGHYGYVDRGRYMQQLAWVLEHFPQKSLHVVLFEDFKRDRLATVQSVYRFLGVDPDVTPRNIESEKNRYMTFRSMRARGVIRGLPAPLRRVAARLNVHYARYPPLGPQVREQVWEMFAESNQALAAWLGRDLSVWRPEHAYGPETGRGVG